MKKTALDWSAVLALQVAVVCAAAAAGLPAGKVIRLPPFLVTTAAIADWKYAVVPGFEILSCCPDADTAAFAQTVCWQQASLDELVPPSLQARETLPVSLILFSEDARRMMAGSVAVLAGKEAREAEARLAAAGFALGLQPDWELLPQVKLWDEDSAGVDIILPHRVNGGYDRLDFAPEYLYFLLARRVPPEPSWFVEGVLNLYQIQRAAAGEAPPPAEIQKFVTVGRQTLRAVVARTGGGDFRPAPALPPLLWLTPKITQALKAHPDFLALQPMGDLLAGTLPPAATPEQKRQWFADSIDPDAHPGAATPKGLSIAEQAAWLADFYLAAQTQLILRHGADRNSPWLREVRNAQIMLFLRWALDDEGGGRRKALWKFVARASEQPVSEKLFRDCFGLGFAEADRRLLQYLPIALKRGFALAPDTPRDFPPVALRAPTPGERARVLGDWQRKEIEFVQASAPEFAGDYIEQADHTLLDAYDEGSRNPGLLAALGIYESKLGENGRAREFLEAAMQAGNARPQARVLLARLRYEEASGKSGNPGGKLDAVRVAFVLQPLEAVRREQPPQLSGYRLTAEVLEHAGDPPSNANLAVLDEGLRFFPGDAELAPAVSRLSPQGSVRARRRQEVEK